jgi:N-acetylneuraminic acid mutarotase
MAREDCLRPVLARGGAPLLGVITPLLLFSLTAQSPAQETWAPTSMTNAPLARQAHRAVWTGSKMIVWGGLFRPGAVHLDTGGIYDPVADTWTATSTSNPPTSRDGHTAVWTGSKMIVWGGWGFGFPGVPVNTGGIYDPAADTWTAMSTTNAPSARGAHAAVWTGSKMIVWGGYGDSTYVRSGGIYDPVTDAWTATSTTNAPSGRTMFTALWAGSKLIVWGGSDNAGPVNTGGLYDPVADTWTATSTTNAPTARDSHTAVWTGSKMIVWGGWSLAHPALLDTGSVYDPVTDNWTAASSTDAPSARAGHTAVWTGSRLLVWGGYDGSSYVTTGGIYDPVTDTWSATSTTNAPLARAENTIVWTGSRMVVWGGYAQSDSLGTGGVYSNPAVQPRVPPAAHFYTVTPCRLVDTRNAAGPSGGPALVAGAVRSFPASGGACGVPSTAIAVSVNLTVTQPAARGYLTLYPGDSVGPPLVSSINFTPGVTRASNAVVLLATTGGTVNVMNRSSAAVHLVLDVNGYFE